MTTTYKHGMTEHQLNAQLTKIDRGRSDGENDDNHGRKIVRNIGHKGD